MKKRILLIMLLLALGLLGGCMASPPEGLIRTGADPSLLIDAKTAGEAHDPKPEFLYFRYQDTAYLAPEQRVITAGLDESLELALVQALLEGPSATQSDLTPLFPPGTRVLSITGDESTLFITFNEALLNRYSDEPKDLSGGQWRVEAPLRRRLCMDSLTATLTTAGLCTQVQVMVDRADPQSNSVRLPKEYFLNGETGMQGFLIRQEDTLLTPRNAAYLFLNAWMPQDWHQLYAMTSSEGRPGDQTAFDAFSSARVLTGFTLSAGDVSPDGKTAILTAEMTLRGDGADMTLTGYPVRLVRQGGVWKMDYQRLLAMMNAN